MRRPRFHFVNWFACSAVVLSSCDSNPEPHGRDQTDQAPESAAATQACSVSISIESAILLQPVSELEGEVNYDRIAAARLLPGGGAVVASGLTLTFFNTAGHATIRAGGSGGGPGAFRGIDGVWIGRGDTLRIIDRRLGAETRYRGDGTMVERKALPALPIRGTSVVAPVGPDQWLLTVRSRSGGRNADDPGVTRDTLTVIRWSPTAADTIGHLLDRRRYEDASRFSQDLALFSAPLLHEPSPGVVLVDDSMVATTTGAVPTLRVVGLHGELIANVTIPDASRPIRPTEVSRYRARYLEGQVGAQAAWVERILDKMPVPEMTPSHDGAGIHWDPHRRVFWIPELAPDLSSVDTLSFNLVDIVGAVRGRVSLPGFDQIEDIGVDQLLATDRSELDEFRVWAIPISCKP